MIVQWLVTLSPSIPLSVCSFVCVHAHVCKRVWSRRLISGVFLDCSLSTLLLETGSLQNLELALGILLSSFLCYWDYRHVSPCPDFTWVLEIWTECVSSCMWGKHFTHWDNSTIVEAPVQQFLRASLKEPMVSSVGLHTRFGTWCGGH